jgi:hypothetical protein
VTEMEVVELTEERKVNVSADVLARICPEYAKNVESHPIAGRVGMGLRIHLRLFWAQLRFRFNDFQTIRSSGASLRLRLRLLWMKIRHHGRLSN